MAEVGTLLDTRPAGYSLSLFSAAVDIKFHCSLCKLVLRDPVQTFCGHRFCTKCLSTAIQNGDVQCSACAEEDEPENKLSTENSFPDKAIAKEISKLDTVCPNSGCTWSGDFRSYLIHTANCVFRLVKCVCEEEVAVGHHEDHLKNDCELRTCQCTYCCSELKVVEKEAHERVCPKFPCQCDKCDAMVTRDVLQAHQDPSAGECTHFTCPYGCVPPIEKSSSKQHNLDNHDEHLGFVVNELQELKDRPECDLQRIEAIERKVGDVACRLEQLAVLRHENNDSQSTAHPTEASPRNKKIEQKLKGLERAVQMNHDLIAVLTNETARNSDSLTHKDCHHACAAKMQDMQNKIRGLERELQLNSMRQQQYGENQEMEARSFDGTLVWKIANFSQKLEDARVGRATSLRSPAFYTDPFGYKLCVKMYPHGDGSGRGTNISLYFVVMKGDFDPILSWPFAPHMVVYQLLDQRDHGKEHHIDAFRPDTSSPCFECPVNPVNPGFGCAEFIAHNKLMDSRRLYVKNDTIFLKVYVKQNRED